MDSLLDEWLEAIRRQLKPTTVDWYEKLAARHVRPALGKVRLSSLRPTHLQKLYAGLDGRMAQAVHRLSHRVCKPGVMWGYLDENPAERVLKPTYSAPRKEMWTLEQLQTFLASTADHWLGPLWTLGLCTGCRAGELLGLKWQDVDLERGTITVRHNLQRVNGQWIESSPKTKAGERTIALPQDGVAALCRQRKTQLEWRLKAGGQWQDSGYAFTGPTGGPVHRSTTEHAMARTCACLGLPPMPPHGSRHLHASLLLKRGLPVPAVSARLEHSRPSITMGVYAHVVGNDDHEAAEVIQRPLGK